MKVLVIHLVPCFKIGGVESAVEELGDFEYQNFTFRRLFIHERAVSVTSIMSLRNFVLRIRELIGLRPSVIICSLWQANLLGVVLKLICPKMRLICFLHSEKSVHFADRICNLFSSLLSEKLFVDSAATGRKRYQFINKERVLISFGSTAFLRGEKRAMPPSWDCTRFVYWGRIHESKGLALAIDLIKDLERDVAVEFHIIGPDEGGIKVIREAIERHNLLTKVQFLGSMEPEQLSRIASNYSFFLMPSAFEGAGRAVLEAMSVGLVPIVRFVGDLENYCIDGGNSINWDSGVLTETVRLVIDKPRDYERLSDGAWSTTRDICSYKNDMCRAVSSLF